MSYLRKPAMCKNCGHVIPAGEVVHWRKESVTRRSGADRLSDHEISVPVHSYNCQREQANKEGNTHE